MKTSVSNQKNNIEIDETNDQQNLFDEETEFLLEEYDQNTPQDDEENNDLYEGVKVNYFILKLKLY